MRNWINSYQKDFWILSCSSFFFFMSFNLILPELSDYLSSLGGASYKGMIIGLFAMAAGLSRPISGKLSDKIGRRPVMYIGLIVCVVLGLMYPLISGALGFLVLRFFHGFSTGFNPTGTVAYVADIIPANKRGEAMGILGMMNNVGMSIGPALGSEISHAFGLNAMFYASTVMALFSFVLVAKIKETAPNAERFKLEHLKVKKVDVFEPSVLLPGIVMLLTIFPFGAILTLIPDQAKYLGLSKQGYFFTVLTLTSVLVRIISGRMSDKYGRAPVLMFGVAFSIIATFMLGLASGVMSLMMAAAVYGLASGINSPTLFAWAIDKSNPAFVGRAMASLFIALELGIVLGSFIPAWIYNNDLSNMIWAFWSCTVVVTLALVILARQKRNW